MREIEQLKEELVKVLEENCKLKKENKKLENEISDLEFEVDELNSEVSRLEDKVDDKFNIFRRELIELGIRTNPDKDRIIKLCQDLFYK